MADTATRFSSNSGGGLSRFLNNIPDPVFGGVGSLLSGIGGLIAGKSDAQKLQEALAQQRLNFGRQRGQFAGRLQQQLRNPGQFSQNIQQQLTPFLNQLNQRRSAKVGLGSGVGLGEILRQGQGGFAQLSAQRQGNTESLIAQLLRG